MKRRDALSVLAAASALCTVRVLSAIAQTSRPPFIGWLGYASGEHSPLKAEFHTGMRQRGLQADRDYILTERFDRNHPDLDAMATEIVVER